ncbi:hypothetical protein NBRC110019_21930 [Neptunitalea chrysea]|uniref:DUF4199 domain-containing protein n=1 Tax=Neptunitalea chrysea TaxID=1647581 RepID=A0A9W6EWL4_9FLAO|nr:DUF4199 domain-containing protein [Neptunitalea chrysea]GLB53153.1 hypothetical protein NBRC110019_21930 [Neptunitalea chrysea]
MKKITLTYGLIAGAIVAAPMLLIANYVTNSDGAIDFHNSMLIGYASMLLAFSMVFVGIRNYRNNYNNGVIGFGKAFTIGGIIVLIASTIYVGTWLIDYFYFVPDFAEVYAKATIADLKANGATQAEIDLQIQEMASFAEMYKNPFYNAMITYMEILPVGLVVTLISSLILKKKATN